MIDFDHVVAEMEGMGRYQICLILVFLYWSMPAGFNVVAPVFVNYIPKYRCKVSEISTCTTGMNESDILNLTTPIKPDGSYDRCKRYQYRNDSICINNCDCIDRKSDVISCNEGYHYDTSLFANTVASELDLICEQAYLDSLATSVYMIGSLIGNLTFGYVSDRWGRKVALGISTIVTQAALIACAFVHSYWLFVACRFVISVFDAGVYYSVFMCAFAEIDLVTTFLKIGIALAVLFGDYPIAMEMVSDKWRTWMGFALHTSFALGYMMLSGFAYLWRDWHGMQIVRQIGKWNRVKINEETIWTLKEDVDQLTRELQNESDIKVKKYSTIDLFNNPGIRFVSLLMMFNCFVVGFVYYGVTLGVGLLSGDIFINNLLGGSVEIAAYFPAAIFANYSGRRTTLLFALCLTCIGLISNTVVATLVDSNHSFARLSIVFSLAARLGISAAFGVILNFTSELFPTVIRGNALAAISLFSVVGGAVAPFVLTLQVSTSWLPNVLFGTTAAFSALLTICLPETKGQHLLESIEAAETFYTKNKFSFGSK